MAIYCKNRMKTWLHCVEKNADVLVLNLAEEKITARLRNVSDT